MNRLIFILAYVLVALSSMAQINVSGVIVEEGSKEPLTGASVILRNAKGKIKKYATSGTNGKFSISTPEIEGYTLDVLMLREDGTGAIEYFYGKMGEVTKTRRTLIVPNQAIATYVTQWTYDSHNRLVEMIYPDEEKVTWDEENRLLSVDDNGFVSNYWYDADGERTVKTSGESDQVYVNGVFSGGSTNTAKFSLYVSPYLVANQGGRYTKHIYAGSQRIVSKVGDFASYGSDPRRIEYAGSETDGISVDYKSKYTAQQQVIKDHYQFFDVPYNGSDNNNYADGEGFCCNDGTQAALMEANKARSRVASRSFKDPDNYESLQFFYHPDHLGSSSYITNLDGEVVQHIEYVPFGEVFIEERNSVWNTPYLFNAKEFDEKTGLYYYGARYYNSRLSLWISVDPISNYDPLNSENYLDEEHNGGVLNHKNLNSYLYCYANPVKLCDPNGKQVVAVHGTWSSGNTWKSIDAIYNYAHKTFNNNGKKYLFNWSGDNSKSARTKAAQSLVSQIVKLRQNTSPNEPLTLVGHSHGGNVIIEAINMLVDMPEFQSVSINILTINTPVRKDYQLSQEARKRVQHINVYDPLDPVQVSGGSTKIPLVNSYVEIGGAGRKFKNAKNIEVNNP